MLAAWTKAVENMNPREADDVAMTLFASAQFEAIRNEETPAANAMAVLANATSEDVKQQIWSRLLNVPGRSGKEAWANAQQPPARTPEPVIAENRFDQNHPFTTDEKIRAEINRRAGVITARIRSITNLSQRAALEGLHAKVKNRNNDQIFAELRQNKELANVVDEYKKLTGPEVFPLLEMAPSLMSDQRPALKAVASYMRQESRALLETGAFSSFVDVLTMLQSDKESRAAVLNELLHISEADRSRAVCYLLDPNDPTSSAMRRLLTAWGDDAAKTAVQNVLQWPDCPPNAVFAVVRALADLKAEARKSLGDRRGLVVMEQFAGWARQHGYAFPAVKPPEEEEGPEPVASKLSFFGRPSKTL